VQTCTPLVYLGPSNDNVVDCKQALDHKKQLKIDWPRVPAHQSRKCQISLERGDANLSSLLDLQMTLKCTVNEPLTKENDGELMKIEYTLLLKHSMTDICKIWWQIPFSPDSWSSHEMSTIWHPDSHAFSLLLILPPPMPPPPKFMYDRRPK